MKICTICSGFSHIYGGVETVVFKLGELWAKQGHEVYIISGLGTKPGPTGVKLIRLPSIPLEYFERLALLTKILTKIFPASEYEGLSLLPFALLNLMEINPDVVLSNQLSETLPALILRIPSVMISQAPIRLRFSAFKHVNRVIVNDFQSYEILRKYGIETDLIFNGVDASKPPEANVMRLRLKYGISNNSTIILTVARLDTGKRINLLIDAFKLIKQDAALIIVGEGSELVRLRKQAYSTKSTNKITFVKPMPHNQLMELYQLCDIFTLPSKMEGFGLVLIEALSFGKPVVTNSIPVKKFVLGDFGVFTNVEDPNEYSASLMKAAEKKIDTSSPEYVNHMKKFLWDPISLQYVELFHKVRQKYTHPYT